MKVEADTNAMKTFISKNLNNSPIKDSLGTSITNIITNNGVTGKDITNGNGIIITGGTGATLQTTSLRIDSSAIARMVNQSPVKDSITSIIKTYKKEKVVVFSSDYTVLADDEILIYRGTGPSGTHTLTLPSVADNKDRVLQIVNMGKGDNIDLNLSTSVLTIGAGTDITETSIRNTVAGTGYGSGASYGNTMKIVSDGTQWIKIGL
jgi:hypothetical protein